MRHKILGTTALILLWTLVVIAATFIEVIWFARPAIFPGDITALKNYMVQKLDDATANHKLGCAALVLIQDNKIVAEHGFGVANAETQAPVKTDRTLFQLASVSKAVTAWGVMELVEEGKLDLDEPVLRYLKRWRFPGSDAYRDKVTVRHLLSHTAGLDDGLGYGGFPPGEPIQTLEESLTLTKDSTVGSPRTVTIAREPGMGMAYSGGGYTILQLLIEEVTNRPFAEYMKETVLRPLGMTQANFDLDSIISEGRAQDLAASYDAKLKTLPHRRYTAKAAVALWATPRDVAKFVQAFTRENPVLKRETLEQMMTPQPGTSASWGLGHTLYVENGAGGYVTGHDGGTYPAWGAIARVNPATGNGVVLMVSGGQGALNRLGHDWIYWETGKVTSEARREIMYGRLAPAIAAIVLGAIALILWRLLK